MGGHLALLDLIAQLQQCTRCVERLAGDHAATSFDKQTTAELWGVQADVEELCDRLQVIVARVGIDRRRRERRAPVPPSAA